MSLVQKPSGNLVQRLCQHLEYVWTKRTNQRHRLHLTQKICGRYQWTPNKRNLSRRYVIFENNSHLFFLCLHQLSREQSFLLSGPQRSWIIDTLSTMEYVMN